MDNQQAIEILTDCVSRFARQMTIDQIAQARYALATLRTNTYNYESSATELVELSEALKQVSETAKRVGQSQEARRWTR